MRSAEVRPGRRSGGAWRRRLFRIHSWAGFNLGFILLVVCASGTLVTLGDEIDWLLHPEYRATPQGDMRSLGELLATVREVYPGHVPTEFEAPRGPRSTASFLLTFPLPEAQEYVGRRVHVDPYTGEIRGETNRYFSVQHHFRLFHKQLFVYGPGVPHGTFIVGFWGLVLLLSGVTGLIVYRTWLANLFRLRLGRTRRFWSDLHRLLGVWGLAFTLVIGGTGVWYLVQQVAGAMDVPLGDDAALAGVFEARAWPSETNLEPLDLDRVVAAVRERVPDFETTSGILPDGPGRPAVIFGRGTGLGPGLSEQGMVAVDPWTGEVLALAGTDDRGAARALTASVSPLHFGDFGGIATRVLWFVLGVAMCVGIVAGVRIWALRTAAASGATATWTDRVLGLGPTLVVVVLAVVYSTKGVSVRILPPDWEMVPVAAGEAGPVTVEVLETRRADAPTGDLAVRAMAGGQPVPVQGAVLVTPAGDSLAFGPRYAGRWLPAGTLPGTEGLRFEIEGIGGERWAGELVPVSPSAPAVIAEHMRPRWSVAATGVGFVLVLLSIGAWWFSLYLPMASPRRTSVTDRTVQSRAGARKASEAISA